MVEILLPLLQACTALQAGEPTRLSHRGGGRLRLVLDVHPTGDPAGVRLEREDTPARPPRPPVRRRALPRGTG